MADHDTLAPSAWVMRWAHLVSRGARVLDLACGHGRHARLFARRGCTVTAVDRDAAALEALAAIGGIRTLHVDLELGPWPFGADQFDGIVVTNYLFRPRLGLLAEALSVGGVLIYETFMLGNEAFGRPRNPEFLLRENELIEVFGASLTPIAFEQGAIHGPRPAVIQRFVGVRATPAARVALAN